ncbi:choice-of-anchor U domain-containing protein [Demequina globuliformis]|uniref:choice-of-anchor U domain-containing protein n=1 Tax=Demequina globuliformis TaxID=676202 RepID=UPI0007858C31|nr:choice-of-anchor U domain-containing protein [Demequina globuliformis]
MLSLFRARGPRAAIAGTSAAALALGLTAGGVTATAALAVPADATGGASCASPQVEYLTELNTDSSFDEWTLSNGSTVEFTADGLAIDSTGKVAYMNYGIERFDVADAGLTDFDYERTSGTHDISLNLAYAEDSSVQWSGTLVYEPGVYGEGNWWSTKDNKADNWRLFTLEDFAAEYPEADVIGVGFSLGSTSVGSGVVSSVTAGCTEYRFSDSASVPGGPQLPSALIGFEQATDADSAEGGLVGVTIAASDAGVAPAAGCFYAEAPVTNYGTHGTDGFVVTRYAGYSDAFPDAGYFASADVYLDAEAPEGQFSWSHALNGPDGIHDQDFVFHAGADGAGNWTVGTGHGANTNADDNYFASYGDSPITISESGWYTFQHTFAAVDGAVVPTLAVLDAAGVELGSWVMDGTDRAVASAGGNRYGWLVNNSYDGLPIDNVLLNAERPSNACDDGSTDGGDTDGGTDGSTDGGTDGSTDGGDTDGGTDGSTDGGTGGSTDGDATQGTTVRETVVFDGDTEATVTVSGIKAPDARALVAETTFTANPSDLGAIPANVSMPFGAFGVTLAVQEGSSATITIDLPSPVNSLYKHLGDGWVEYPATFSGTTVEFVVTDGGAGDADGEVNGVIVDPAAPALTATFTG